MCKIYDKFVGRLLYGFYSNKDWKHNYVFWGWLIISCSQAVGLFAFNEILLNDILGIGFNTDFLDLGFKTKQINAILPSLFYFSPFGLFNYFYFVRNNRYTDLMEKYKYAKTTSLVWIGLCPYILLMIILIIHFLVKNHLI